MRSVLFTLLGGGLALTACPAVHAAPADFISCDAYAAPTAKADSMTRDQLLWGLASTNSDLRPTKLALGPHQIARCDGALADPLLKPQFVLRRINLMQAKALHQLGSGRPEDALQTLDQARLIAVPEAPRLHERGLALSNKVLRTLALIEAGSKDDATRLLAEVRAARPYSSSLHGLADALEGRIDPTLKTQFDALRRVAPLRPGAAMQGLILAVMASDFRRAVEFGSGLTVELPKQRGGWTVEGAPTEYELIKTRADIAGSLAYSLAALGDHAKAEQRLAAARADIFEAATPPVPSRPGGKISGGQQRDYQQRKAFAEQAALRLVAWQKLIELRGRIPAMTSAEALPAIAAIKTGSVTPVIDLLRLVRVAPEEEAARTETIAKLVNSFEEQRRELFELKLDELLEMLPRAETPGNQPRFKQAGDGYFLSDNGFSQRKMDSDDKWTVRFTNALASPIAVEELVVLSAAHLARKQGYDGFVIEARRILERTTHMVGMYGGGSVNSGREGQLVVRLVHGTKLPDDLAGAEWRVLKADEVIARIAADYPQRTAPSR